MKPLTYRAMLEFDDVVRYLAIGFEDEAGFTGLVTDTTGGGNWGDLYMLNGERDAGIEPEEASDCDDDEFEEAMERAYPGLMERVHALRESLVGFDDDCVPRASEKLMKAFSEDGEAGNGTFPWVDGYNTGF